jgi:uncharacterized protein YkwD
VALARRAALLIALVFGVSAVVELAHPDPVDAWSGGSFSSASERALVRLTNRSRAAAGRRSLRIDATLTAIARWRSKDMIRRDYFSHRIPGYGSVFDKLSAKGYCYRLAGENIGWNNAPDDRATARIHEMFMDSSGHRRNVLGRRWDRIGIGAYKSASGKHMWTVIFADKCGGGGGGKPDKPDKPRTKPKSERSQKNERSKPKPTPKPTPTPTPTPFPMPPAVEFEVFGHRPLDVAEGAAPSPPAGAGDGPAAGGSGASPLGVSGLLIVDDTGPPGLLDSIAGDAVGDVLGG